ncbi:hypothetical protein F7725_003677, partial [Dissostichus mawsoni]
MTQYARPNVSQDTTNTRLKIRNMYRQRTSTHVVKISDMYRCDFSSILADKAAVVLSSRLNLAIAEAAHCRHCTQSQALFFTGHKAVMLGPSHTHASVGLSQVLTISPAHTKLIRLT